MSTFASKVYGVVRKIPRGRVLTYKQVANLVGNSKAGRAVGNALNRNPFSPEVPCHRVVRFNGLVGGYASGAKNKIKVLRKEGVEIKNNKIDLGRFN
ncbi:MAG: MGMT family protein [Patescibacteria group bacterium]|nr:MGMT family protein [Patescibacteria group bacterium]